MKVHAPRRRPSTVLVAAPQWLEPTAADLAAIAAAAARPRHRPRRSLASRASCAAAAARAAAIAAIVRQLDHAAAILHEIAAGIAAENA